MFDVREHLDELRCRETAWLVTRREELEREARRIHVEQLAVIAVLDERRALDDDLAARDGVSERSLRTTVETARALESLPAIAAKAYAGELSAEQLAPLVELADEASDAEWAERGARTSPVELAREARRQVKPSAAEVAARREARHLRVWVDEDRGMVALRGELADVDGMIFKSVIDEMTNAMRPAQGRSWDSLDHRQADALVLLARSWRDGHAQPAEESPTPARAKPLVVVHVRADGPAEVCGVPLADVQVEALLAQARVEPVLDDPTGAPVTTGRVHTTLTPKIQRAVLLRDGQCRWPGCGRRGWLQIHHMIPRSWGGGSRISDLLAVCTGHHPKLAPQGEWMLVGNPNRLDGLRLLTVAQWLAECDRPDPRARPPTAA